jgi:hypothetical protein
MQENLDVAMDMASYPTHVLLAKETRMLVMDIESIVFHSTFHEWLTV